MKYNLFLLNLQIKIKLHMPYKITNITGNNKFKQKVPVVIPFDNGTGTIVKHKIEPGEHLILYSSTH